MAVAQLKTDTPPPVDLRVAGKEHLRTLTAQKHFGKLGFRVWTMMLWHRHPHGRLKSYVTNGWLAARLGVSKRAVEKAAQRLRKAGALETEGDGWYTIIVDKAGRTRKKKVFFRRVIGDFRCGQIYFPKKVAKQLQTLPGWGGARAGAGRSGAPPNDFERFEAKYECDPVSNCWNWTGNTTRDKYGMFWNGTRSVGAHRWAYERAVGPIPKGLELDHLCENPGCVNPDHLEPVTGEENRRRYVEGLQNWKSSRRLIFSSGRKNGGSSDRSKKRDQEKRGSSSKEEHTVSAEPAPAPSFGSKMKRTPRVVPPFPSAHLFHLAKIPNPPLIPDEASDLDAVRMLLRSYWGATESRYGKKSWVLAKGDITASRHYPNLVKAANALRDLGYAPAAWAAWALDYWKSYLEEHMKRKKNKNRPPPLSFVFNEKFIHDRRGHFRSESLSYAGGTLIFPAYFREVMRRYGGMEWAFRMDKPKTQLEIGHIVEHWFPNGWKYHYRMVRNEAQNDRARLQRMLQRGEWLWA